ncbi:hypothetical protein [Streptomyces sp. NPDC047000]|uniref:hypothetical protein n=1 Tax=Streptomyces sp. NPDC047000 TaxID=3155474 RepID=UPI0033EAFAC1
MVFSPDDFQPIPSPRSSARARERGLRRSRRLTRWIAVTAVAGAAALGGFYTHLLPGGSAAPAPTGPAPVQSPATSSSATAAGGAGQHDDGGEQGDDEGEGAAPAAQPAPQPPAQPPVPAQQQPHTTTGAS